MRAGGLVDCTRTQNAELAARQSSAQAAAVALGHSVLGAIPTKQDVRGEVRRLATASARKGIFDGQHEDARHSSIPRSWTTWRSWWRGTRQKNSQHVGWQDGGNCAHTGQVSQGGEAGVCLRSVRRTQRFWRRQLDRFVWWIHTSWGALTRRTPHPANPCPRAPFPFNRFGCVKALNILHWEHAACAIPQVSPQDPYPQQLLAPFTAICRIHRALRLLFQTLRPQLPFLPGKSSPFVPELLPKCGRNMRSGKLDHRHKLQCLHQFLPRLRSSSACCDVAI